MKQSLKNEADVLDLMNKIQAQLTALDKKVDSLMIRSITSIKPVQSPIPQASVQRSAIKPNSINNNRTMHKATCADCQKECSIPFKPSGDRPVYCQDCFSRRKMVSMSKIGMDEKPKEAVPTPKVTETVVDVQRIQARRKRTLVVKKTVAKKKTAAKKK